MAQVFIKRPRPLGLWHATALVCAQGRALGCHEMLVVIGEQARHRSGTADWSRSAAAVRLSARPLAT